MKNIALMSNLEKGKLLLNLFPNEKEGIINSMASIYKILVEKRSEIETNWNNPFISVAQWYRLAEFGNDIALKNKGKQLGPNRFVQELFDGYIAFFTIDCIIKYAARERKETKFWHLVQALFVLE